MIVRTNESEKEKAKEGEERVERVAKLVCGRKERGRGEKGERRRLSTDRARLALANHTGVRIEMRNGADRPATITPIS